MSPLYHREEGDDQFVQRATKEGRVGGMAYIATIANRQRNQLPDRTLLLDSGDTWHGTIVPVRLGGTPVVKIMNAMGYDAMTPGNVDMFYDQETLEKLFTAANFPILMANIYDAEWGERPELPNTQPYIIKKINGYKIGIIGMTYHWMSKVSDQPQWTFGLRVEEVQNDIDKLRKEDQVDLVIMLSHMGWETDAKYAELVDGIDVIIGAHTHNILYRPTLVYNEKSQRDVIIVQSGSHGKMLGQLDISISNKRVESFQQTLFPIRSKDIQPDPIIASLIADFRAPFKEELERVIGVTETLIYRQGLWQSTGDNLVTNALRARSKQEVALTEPGKYGASVLPGKITVEDVYNLVPTDSPIYHMKISGVDLRAMLEAAIDNVISDNVLERVGSNMVRYAGIEIAIDLSRPYPERIQSFKIEGNLVEEDRLYTLAEFNLFIRNSPSVVDIEQTDKIGPKEVIAYIEASGKVSPKLDSRITDPKGNMMTDHPHLEEYWHKSGRNEANIDSLETFQYKGELGKNNRFVQ